MIQPAPDSNRRRLHSGHFAFMRAITQGLDPRTSWDRYLQGEGGAGARRAMHSTIGQFRNAFAAAARRHRRPGLARLVLLDLRAAPSKSEESNAPAGLPSLASFAETHQLDGFSETEQLVLYQEHYGAATSGTAAPKAASAAAAAPARQARRAALIEKQLAALFWLEGVIAEAPRADDPLDAWLVPELAGTLNAAGLATIRQLVEHINGIGQRWTEPIRAIGAGKGAQLLAWLRAHEASLQLTIGVHVARPRAQLRPDELARVVPHATAIVPLDKLIIPVELDGSAGRFRAPAALCLLQATNDHQAVMAWIRSRRGLRDDQRAERMRRNGSDAGRDAAVDAHAPAPASASASAQDWLQYLSHTQRAYLKEAERFLLWAVVQQQKPLSSMTLEDCQAYRDFLVNPTPAERWCGPPGREKWSPLWRPFVGPLSASAQRHAVTVLKSLYKFLVDQCYLVGNPWNGVQVAQAARAKPHSGRSFTQDQWRWVCQRLEELNQLEPTSATQRLQFALPFFYATGVRLSEGVAARIDDLRWVSYAVPDAGPDEPDVVEGWELTIVGKGNKLRTVTVPDGLVSALSTYLQSRGLDPDPRAPSNEGAYLLGRVTDVAERTPWSAAARSPIDPKAGIASGTLYDQLKRFFRECAATLEASDARAAQRLATASTHWLRHTHGSHAAAAGMPLDLIQQNMGHASIDTTTIYVTSEERRRMQAMQAIWRGKPAQGGMQ